MREITHEQYRLMRLHDISEFLDEDIVRERPTAYMRLALFRFQCEALGLKLQLPLEAALHLATSHPLDELKIKIKILCVMEEAGLL